MNKNKILLYTIITLMFGFLLVGCTNKNTNSVNINNIPEFSNDPYIVVNNNEPNFSDSDFTTDAFENYAPLDSKGRCGVAYANICKEIMPTEKRKPIGSVKPTGWHTIKYSNVDGKYLYNRCHLIGHQLAAENANEKNLITGTRYLNIDGMLPFENLVADYVKETNNHVLYRVTPIFKGDNLLATGVQMEGISVEDKGKSIKFNIFAYNSQPNITINYVTGESTHSKMDIQNNSDNNNNNTNDNSKKIIIRANKSSKIYHIPGQNYYEKMKTSKNLIEFNSEQEAIDAGYRKAKN